MSPDMTRLPDPMGSTQGFLLLIQPIDQTRPTCLTTEVPATMRTDKNISPPGQCFHFHIWEAFSHLPKESSWHHELGCPSKYLNDNTLEPLSPLLMLVTCW